MRGTWREVSSREVLSFDLSKGKIGFLIKYLGNLVIEHCH